jgi:hypothetical protein
MTATEVLERAREKGMLLAPTAGRMQAEFLGPLIEREIDLLARQGLMPPKMPQILIDAAVEYRIEYDNPLSRMARAEKASGFMRALSQAAEYAKMTQRHGAAGHFRLRRRDAGDSGHQRGADGVDALDLEDIAARRDQRSQAAQRSRWSTPRRPSPVLMPAPAA